MNAEATRIKEKLSNGKTRVVYLRGHDLYNKTEGRLNDILALGVGIPRHLIEDMNGIRAVMAASGRLTVKQASYVRGVHEERLGKRSF